MKLVKLFIVTIYILSISPMPVSAHPGGLDANGCHTCRTNCEDYGLFYGQYHCHNTISTPTTPSVPPSSSSSSTNWSSIIRGLIVLGGLITAIASYALKQSSPISSPNEISTDALKKKNRNIHE
jgi:hypothetical protein